MIGRGGQLLTGPAQACIPGARDRNHQLYRVRFKVHLLCRDSLLRSIEAQIRQAFQREQREKFEPNLVSTWGTMKGQQRGMLRPPELDAEVRFPVEESRTIRELPHCRI